MVLTTINTDLNDVRAPTKFLIYKSHSFKMNSGTGFNGQHQQYAQPLQQKSKGTSDHDYASTTQQTLSEQVLAQQGVLQPPCYAPMQQVYTQQPSPFPQTQQQPSYQYYKQGNRNFAATPLPLVEPWMQIQPSAQWQTATNSATTRTTTTTTTKEYQASRPDYAISSTDVDFASLIQQTPQVQQFLQQQQVTPYSNTMQSEHQQQTMPPSATDYSRLMQNNPQPTQNTVNFSQLMQTAPPPQPQVSQAPPVIQAPSNNQTTKTSTTATVDSTSRQKAAESGEAALRRFDRDVSNRLKQSTFGGICPMGWDYYATRQGYICGGSNHYVSHQDVEAMLACGRSPRIEFANGPLGTRVVTPPPATGQLDGSGRMPVWNYPQWWETHRYMESMDSMSRRGY